MTVTILGLATTAATLLLWHAYIRLQRATQVADHGSWAVGQLTLGCGSAGLAAALVHYIVTLLMGAP